MVCYEIAADPEFNVAMNVTVENSILAKKFAEKNLPFIALKMKKSFNWKSIKELRKTIKENNIELIVVQQLRDLIGLRLALWGMDQVKVIGFSHTFVGYSKKDLLHSWAYRKVSVLISLTELQKENLLAHLPVESQQLRVIPNAVNTEWITPAKRSEELRKELSGNISDAVLIGLVGRLDKGKGQTVLLESALLLKQKGLTNFKIILVGEETRHEPGTLQKLKSYVAANQLENNVIFTGFRSDIPEINASLDIIVMASDAETFGRVVIEGMAAGVPVVATGAGGVPDIIDDGKNGLLFPPRNPQALADALEKLIKDKTLRSIMGSAGRAKAQVVYDSKIVNRQLQKAFTEA